MKTLLFITSGLGDNLITLPLALELEEKTQLTAVAPAGAQWEFFSACLPRSRVIAYDGSIASMITILKKGWASQAWVYPVGVSTRRVRWLHWLALFRRAIGFTSFVSRKAWLVELGFDDCLVPDLAKRGWKNNLRLLPLLGLTASKTWEDYIRILRPRLKRMPRKEHSLIIHAGSARYPGGLERYKRWPLERFFEVVSALLRSGAFREACWVLGPDDETLEPGLKDLIERSSHARQMSILSTRRSKMSLLETGSFLSSAGYLLSNDSGLAHLASLYEVPMTTLISGLGEPAHTAQNGSLSQILIEPTECYGCAVGISREDALRFQCHHEWACMDRITAGKVQKSISSHLETIRENTDKKTAPPKMV